MTSTRTVFETPQTAQYKFPTTPQVRATLGQAPNPRLVVGPAESIPNPSTPLPTTSQTNKKTSVQIPYTRVVADPRLLDENATVAFVYADRQNYNDFNVTSSDRIERLASIGSVNLEIDKNTKAASENEWKAASYWRPDGILLSTEDSSMDPDRSDYLPDEDRVSTSSAALVSIQGPTLVRNDFVTRPLINDVFYCGLAWRDDGTFEWFNFCSQHLDIKDERHFETINRKHGLNRPHGSLASIDPVPNTRTTIPDGFTRERMKRLCLAYKIGTVVDTNPAPGCVTLNVNVWPVMPSELGLRFDYNDDPADGPVTVTKISTLVTMNTVQDGVVAITRKFEKKIYSGFIGSKCGKIGMSVAALIAAPQQMKLVDCQNELESMIVEINDGVKASENNIATFLFGPSPPPENAMEVALDLVEEQSIGVWRSPIPSSIPRPYPKELPLDDQYISKSTDLKTGILRLVKPVHCALTLLNYYIKGVLLLHNEIVLVMKEFMAILTSFCLLFEIEADQDFKDRLYSLIEDDDWSTLSAKTYSGALARIIILSAALEDAFVKL